MTPHLSPDAETEENARKRTVRRTNRRPCTFATRERAQRNELSYAILRTPARAYINGY